MGAVLFETLFHTGNGEEKRLRIVQGDLCRETQVFDVVICSAYKGRYYPTEKSFIGTLFWDKNISVDMLAQRPAIDMRESGFWLSEETDSNFKRIGCMELLTYGKEKENVPVILKSKFSTMRYVLEQATINGISVSKVAMPLMGAGEEGIELPYIASALFRQAEMALLTIDELKEISIFEIDEHKAEALKRIFTNISNSPKDSDTGKVFISYSSKQEKEAHSIMKAIEERGYKCWIAPECIPPSSSYIEEIANALKTAQVIVLLLTKDAESSIWVSKEVGTALGSCKTVIPYRTQMYPLGDTFAFLLHDVQILTNEEKPDTYKKLIDEIEKSLSEQKR